MWAFPGVPLLVWLLPTLAERRRWPAVTLTDGALHLMLVTFSPSGPYLLVFAIGWSVLLLGRRHWRPYAVIGLFFDGLALIELPQMFATLRTTRRTAPNRGS